MYFVVGLWWRWSTTVCRWALDSWLVTCMWTILSVDLSRFQHTRLPSGLCTSKYMHGWISSLCCGVRFWRRMWKSRLQNRVPTHPEKSSKVRDFFFWIFQALKSPGKWISWRVYEFAEVQRRCSTSVALAYLNTMMINFRIFGVAYTFHVCKFS